VRRSLQIVLGRERGRVYPIDVGAFVVGRGSDCDIVLASEIVSRRHATIEVGLTSLNVTDLGSSNGTYINGARIVGEGVVVQGDVLLAGDVAMRLHGSTVPELPPLRPGVEAGTSTNLAGSLVEVPPATVLRYLAVIKKTGVLRLTSPPVESRVTFTRGHISAVVVSHKKRDPAPALTSMLRWRGTFDVGPPSTEDSNLLLGLDAVLPAIGSAARLSKPPAPKA
jgi:hypothetical protein